MGTTREGWREIFSWKLNKIFSSQIMTIPHLFIWIHIPCLNHILFIWIESKFLMTQKSKLFDCWDFFYFKHMQKVTIFIHCWEAELNAFWHYLSHLKWINFVCSHCVLNNFEEFALLFRINSYFSRSKNKLAKNVGIKVANINKTSKKFNDALMIKSPLNKSLSTCKIYFIYVIQDCLRETKI